MLFSEPIKSAVSIYIYIYTREGERKRQVCPRLMILRRRGRRLERRADCEGIKFVTGELRREWHTEERFLCGRGRKNNYRARLIDRPGYRLFFLFLNNIDDIAEAHFIRQAALVITN